MSCISPRYRVHQAGFSLIELLIVIAIIALLVSIALPSYIILTNRAKDNACLSEAKAYSNHVYLALNDQEADTLPTAPIITSCLSMTDATDWTIATQQAIVATSKSSTANIITCDIANGSPCDIFP
mgnify:CR=1 FL=1